MFDFVGTPPFRRIALWVVMEAMHLTTARLILFVGIIFGGHALVPMNNLIPLKTCPGVARLVKLDTSVSVTLYMFLFSVSFLRFSYCFYGFPPPPSKKQQQQKKTFPLDFWGLFSMKQDTFLMLKLLITFLKELVMGQGSFSAKCTHLF